MERLWTPLLLVGSNLFMTYAWYGHLRDLKSRALWLAVVASWGVALFEYMLQVPANRIGFQQAGYSLQQLKVMQEVITMAVFAVFAVAYMRERLSVNFVYATLCLVAAAWFMFRDLKAPA
jgi:uncharacterized protein (DUF486 family)